MSVANQPQSTGVLISPNKYGLLAGPIRWLKQPTLLLLLMVGLQVLWLAATWLTGASQSGTKLAVLGGLSLLGGLGIILLPAPWVSAVGRAKAWLLADDRRVYAALVALMLGVGLVYAYYQRVWPYDEENNFKAASLVAEQGLGPFFAEYANIPWLGQWHPPLTPLLYGLTAIIFGPHLLAMRLISVVMAAGLVLTTYVLGRSFYDRETGLWAALFLASFSIIVRQGSTAMTDVPVSFFFTAAMLLVLALPRRPSFGLAALTGLVLGAGLLTKYTMVFIYPVIFSYFLFFTDYRRIFWYLVVAGAVSGGMLLAWLGYAASIGVLSAQQASMVTEFEPGYFLKDAGGQRWLLESLLTRLTSALGLYSIPLILVGVWQVLRRRTRPEWLLLLWVGVVSVLLLFTLPDHRYFMPTFPALAVMMAVGIKRLSRMSDQIVLLALLYGGVALYLFVDWFRAAQLFNQ